ncbi:MAG: menaquinone biosynthesis protein [Ferruginibacter sp.]
MERKIRVAAVSYLNTKPLIYGFEQGMMKDEIELVFDYPANVARMLVNDEVDIGLIPVAAIPLLKEYHIISDYCIGANFEVASVCLFSEVPLDKIEKILLDYQSRTSVALLKILLKYHWKKRPEFLTARMGYEKEITGTTAGLVIGDRALKQRIRSPYIYDLASSWREMTGLPFVFAVWVSNKKLPDEFIESFDAATAIGMQHIDEIVKTNVFNFYNLETYYRQNISYLLDDRKREGLELFLKFLANG